MLIALSFVLALPIILVSVLCKIRFKNIKHLGFSLLALVVYPILALVATISAIIHNIEGALLGIGVAVVIFGNSIPAAIIAMFIGCLLESTISLISQESNISLILLSLSAAIIANNQFAQKALLTILSKNWYLALISALGSIIVPTVESCITRKEDMALGSAVFQIFNTPQVINSVTKPQETMQLILGLIKFN